jgi:hypothetical protein
MRDYESPPRMMDDLEDWMIRMKAALTWMNGFPRMDAMIRIESSSLSLKFRFKNKSLGFA